MNTAETIVCNVVGVNILHMLYFNFIMRTLYNVPSVVYM